MKKNLDNLQPGESCVYATCYCLSLDKSEDKATALDMYLRGIAELTQRRLADGKIEHIITRRRVPRTEKEIKRTLQYYASIKNAV